MHTHTHTTVNQEAFCLHCLCFVLNIGQMGGCRIYCFVMGFLVYLQHMLVTRQLSAQELGNSSLPSPFLFVTSVPESA